VKSDAIPGFDRVLGSRPAASGATLILTLERCAIAPIRRRWGCGLRQSTQPHGIVIYSDTTPRIGPNFWPIFGTGQTAASHRPRVDRKRVTAYGMRLRDGACVWTVATSFLAVPNHRRAGCNSQRQGWNP
jgi:hypothetical protein